jgi:hypothetical protein
MKKVVFERLNADTVRDISYFCIGRIALIFSEISPMFFDLKIPNNT